MINKEILSNIKYRVEIYNYNTKSWDIMKYEDFRNDGKEKDAVFKHRCEAEGLEKIANALSYITTRIIKIGEI
jgi:hypothetical protein